MSTLRISNIEAKSVPASATTDEKIKITNSSGDVLVFIDGKTSGITTVGINTTDGNIKFDANSNVVVTGIITATKFSGAIEPTDLTVSGKVSVGGSVTAATFYGNGANLTGISAGTSLSGSTNNTIVTVTGANAIQGEANLTFDGDNIILSGNDGRRFSFAGGGTSHYMKYDNTLGGIILNGYGGIAFETNGTNERFRITSTGLFGFGTNSPNSWALATFNYSNGISLTGSTQTRLVMTHQNAGSNLKNFDIQLSDGNLKFRSILDNNTTVTERVRITTNGDLKVAASTALSSPNTGYKRIVIGNNLILNAGTTAGGYTGFQNNAYVNSSGQWVRVNNDYASSIGMDDGVFYFRNAGAGTGTISWSTPLQINANGASTFSSTLTVNGYVLSQGTSGRGGVFGQIQVGLGSLYNTIQNAQSNTPIHLQYNNTGDVKCNEGGGDLRTADIIPHTNNSASLGTNAIRWANIHTNDLNLSNEGNSNEVDGTWGQYTIQEGEHDLFLINRRSGKKYKFLLQEID